MSQLSNMAAMGRVIGLPLLFTVLACVVRLYFNVTIEQDAPLLPFLAAIFLSAYFSGVLGGILSTIICVVAYEGMGFDALSYTLALVSISSQTLALLTMGVLLSIFFGRLRREHDRARSLVAKANDWRNRYEVAIRTSRHLLIDWELQSNQVTLAGGVAEVLGIETDELQISFSELIDMIHPDDRRHVQRELINTARSSSTVHLSFRLLRGGSETVYCEFDGLLVQGDLVRRARVLGFARDVTASALAEASLRESEQRFRELADALPQLIWVSSREGEPVYLNQRWYEYAGHENLSAIEKIWDALLAPDEAAKVKAAYAQSIADESSLEIECRLRRADGSYRWFLARAVPIRGKRGMVTRWLGTCTDIEDQKQAAVERQMLLESERSARSEAERASRSKDQFVANLSHELRTPLNAVLGWATMLRRGTLPANVLQQGLEVIERNTRLQAQLISDLLDISRITSGKLQLNLRALDLRDVVRAAVESVHAGAEAKGITIDVDMPYQPEGVMGDEARLQQILWNLLSNAVKFSPQNSKVIIRMWRRDGRVSIAVQDFGEGIDESFLPHLFERYRQAEETKRRPGGLGLGLSIARNLVELHGGTIEVASDGKGKGATFTVTLPVLRGRLAVPAERGVSAPALPKTEATLEGVRVLMVDDEPDARELVKRLLEEHKAVVTTAASVDEALETLPRTKPDVLLSDIGMPEKDGYELIRALRKLPTEQGGELPAVAVTAFARNEDRARALRMGFQAHLSKPIEPSDLIATVESLTRHAPSILPESVT